MGYICFNLKESNSVKNKNEMTEETQKKVTVSGNVIQSTIDTMEGFGRIGQEILQSHGISKIKANEQYPYELRSDLHRVALERFGKIALVAFGFEMGDYLSPVFVDDMYQKSNSILNQFENRSSEGKVESLEKFLTLYCQYVTKFFQNSIVSDESIEYGMWYKKRDDFIYEIRVTSAYDFHQEPFLVGIQDYVFARCLGNRIGFSRVFEQKKSHAGYGYATWVWKLSFHFASINKTSDEIVALKKLEINQELMKAVLDHADSQKQKVEEISQKLGKYLPPQIHNAFFSGNYDTVIDTRRKKLTIFFSDIKNFTSTSEGLQPEDLTKYLNEYFSEMTAIALKYGATIDKYIGDAMMVFFGDPESQGEREDARACVEMALMMQERMRDLQKKWRDQGFADPFQVRIGINTGYCNVGNFGSDQRLTYTIIGGEVNVAQRLEANAEANGILMSYETYAHAQDMIQVKERDSIKMKGISREIKVFSVIERKDQTSGKKLKSKKKLTRNEISDIEQLKQDMVVVKTHIEDLNKNMEKLFKKT